jgi:ATP-dependent Lon protease
VIERYTREAGVRELERMISKLMRKAVRKILKNKKVVKLNIDETLAEKLLGVPRFEELMSIREDRIGAVTGLAWTQAGGDLLVIETDKMAGKGTLTLTGNLGDVMQESARAALTAVRSRAEQIGFDGEEFLKSEVHVHFPETAVSKDGPSAGITTAVSIASAFSRRPVRGEIAMTGELTLRGNVLAIGGLREKLMAAVRGGIKRVLIPEKNLRDLSEVPDEVKRPLEITTVKNLDEVLEIMLLPKVSDDTLLKRHGSRKNSPKSRSTTISS